MKNIRLGNDISIKWYVYRMNTPEDFNGKTVEVHLLDKNDVKQNFTYKIEDGLISGVFYGKNQMTTGAYRLVLVENSGKNNMVTLDYVDAFILNSKMHNATSSGADTACNMKTQIVNLTSIMSRQTGVTNLYDYYTRDEVDEILKGYAKTVDLEQYALKTDIPDYSTTYAPLEHTHSEYLTSESDPTVPAYVKSIRQSDIDNWNAATGGVDLSKYVTKNELDAASYITADQVTYPDYSNTYANINHTHDQYLTEHQDLSAYVKTTDLESYALKTDIPDTSSYLTYESDPTVPAYVKSIKQSDIDAWNAATGGVDLSNYVTKNELDAASYITADQVTYPDYSNTYANINHTHDQYAKAVDLQSYALKTELFSKDYNDLTNKPTIPSEYDDTQVRNLIDSKQDKLTESQIANLNVDHSKYLTEHQTLPDYSNTYAPLEHTHNQYLESESDPTVPAYVKSIKQSDIDAWNAATGGVDLSNYVTKNELDAASYITADQVTYPDYSNTYANINHTHDQYAALHHTHSEYITEHQDLSAYVKTVDLELYAKKTDIPDTSNFATKDEIVPAYDDTEVRNMIAGKQDKLSEQQIANLNADHSKYLTQHQDLSAYVKTVDLESYALKTDIPDTSSYLTSESDPTVPAYVKSIKQSDIDAWNAATGGVDLSNYVTKNELDAASYITADQVTYPDYSNTYANINHTHNQYAALHHTHSEYLTEHQDLSAYVKTTDLESYAKKTDIPDTSNFATKDEIVPAYDDTEVRNMIAGKQDKLTESQIANLNADHSKYITEHQTLPDYSTTYANINHTHDQYLTEHQDLSAYVKTTDLQFYVTKNELDAASYITADQVTYPDYSNTYANINHTHDQYLTEHQDLSAYALKTELFSKDYNDLTNKPTIPSEYDDTEVRNMIASKQDKLSEQQITNLNVDHSKYLTEHQDLSAYVKTVDLQSYATLSYLNEKLGSIDTALTNILEA